MTSTSAESKKKSKRNGPVRWEIGGPVLILCVLTWAYFTFLFDANLRWLLQWGMSRANGAQVDIASLKTSFTRGTFKMQGIQVTDPAEPKRNRFMIGNVGWDLNMDALLRAKLVIESLGAEGIEVYAPRAQPGYVLPPSPPSSSEGGLMDKLKEQAEKEFGAMPLSRLGETLTSFDPKSKIGELGNLKSKAKIDALQKDLPKKQAEWEQALTQVPGEKELGSLSARVSQIKIGGTSNPGEIQGQISQAQSVLTEAQSSAQQTRAKADALTGGVTAFGSEVGKVDGVVKEDVTALESKLGLPRLDAQSLGYQILGPKLMPKLAQVLAWLNKSRSGSSSGKSQKVMHQRC